MLDRQVMFKHAFQNDIAMVFTAEQNAFILMAHFRSATHNPDGSWTCSLESCIAQFNEAFPDANIPYDVFVQHKRRVLDRFDTKNCICTGKSTGRPSFLTQPAVDDIQQRIEDSPKKSLRKLSAQTDVDNLTDEEELDEDDLLIVGIPNDVAGRIQITESFPREDHWDSSDDELLSEKRRRLKMQKKRKTQKTIR
ncbi:hypothetical protein MML48_4g00015189 [Holotrichia oblita]|uniref:Uncharacterized protein n=1 Tax=Holotrichia oblita TaxID=644536 RepID=A0ACB9T6G4_HOLOL|nr:hypothetical protein MML48_4g00015189 [Holotrichia oblita]